MVEVDGVVTRFGQQTIHDGVSFSIGEGTAHGLTRIQADRCGARRHIT